MTDKVKRIEEFFPFAAMMSSAEIAKVMADDGYFVTTLNPSSNPNFNFKNQAEWCEEHAKDEAVFYQENDGKGLLFSHKGTLYHWYFRNKNDALQFKLKWS